MDMGCNRRVHDDSKVLSWERFCIEVNNERVLTESFCQQKRHPADKKRSPKQNTPEGLSHSEEGEAGKDTSLKIILLSKGLPVSEASVEVSPGAFAGLPHGERGNLEDTFSHPGLVPTAFPLLTVLLPSLQSQSLQKLWRLLFRAPLTVRQSPCLHCFADPQPAQVLWEKLKMVSQRLLQL
ncbi:uncharacterized protein LOC144295325 isoform X1 [Canis aureus]